MSDHVALEQLSALVDDEIGGGERSRLERHLAACPPCRARLDELRAVSLELGRTGREQAPAALDLWVARRVGLERERRPRTRLALDRIDRWTSPSGLLVPFAVVLGLSAAVYLLAHARARLEMAQSPTRVVVVPLGAVLGAPTVEVGERTFRRTDEGWVEADNSEIPGPPRPAKASETAAILAALPGLEPLRADGPVTLVWRGSWIRLTPAEGEARAPVARAETPLVGGPP